MVSKRSPKPEKKREVKAVEAAKVGGHAIIIRSVHEQKQESLQLLLDGKRVPFLETDDGYLVGYTQAKSLLEAAKLYAKRRFDVGRKKGGK